MTTAAEARVENTAIFFLKRQQSKGTLANRLTISQQDCYTSSSATSRQQWNVHHMFFVSSHSSMGCTGCATYSRFVYLQSFYHDEHDMYDVLFSWSMAMTRVFTQATQWLHHNAVKQGRALGWMGAKEPFSVVLVSPSYRGSGFVINVFEANFESPLALIQILRIGDRS